MICLSPYQIWAHLKSMSNATGDKWVITRKNIKEHIINAIRIKFIGGIINGVKITLKRFALKSGLGEKRILKELETKKEKISTAWSQERIKECGKSKTVNV